MLMCNKKCTYVLYAVDVLSVLILSFRDHGVQVVHVTMVAEDHHLDQAGALIVELMATGLEIVKQVTGRTSVTAVESEAI